MSGCSLPATRPRQNTALRSVLKSFRPLIRLTVGTWLRAKVGESDLIQDTLLYCTSADEFIASGIAICYNPASPDLIGPQ
jgi:hypothetical protein